LAELRDGSVRRAVATYRERRRIVVGSCPEETLARAVRDWYRHVQASGDLEGTLLLAHTNGTVADLNARAREHMAASGHLRGRALQAGERAFRAGDRVLARKNRARLGVLNGDLGTVVEVDPERGALTLRMDRGGETRELPAWYLSSGHLEHGYALTGHKAQGVTVRRSFTVAGGGIDREWTYVTMSRGREANTLYMVSPNPEEECIHLAHRRPEPAEQVVRALGRTSTQTAAVDIGHMPEVDPLDPPPSNEVAARVAWLVGRRKLTRDLERDRKRGHSGLERDPPAVGMGR
ncbi:MAG: ATP-dependent DNA helicase, partial [Acidimicrobiia bacterium]